MGQYPVEPFHERVEWTRRIDAESVCAGSKHLGIEFGIGSGCVGEFMRGGGGNGNGWIDHFPVELLRVSGIETDCGFGEPGGYHPDLRNARYGWTNGPKCTGRGNIAGGHDWG